MHGYQATVKLKNKTSTRISTEPAKTKPLWKHSVCNLCLQSTGFYLHCDVSSRCLKASVIQSRPCEDGLQPVDFTESYSEDGVKSTVSLLAEFLLFPIYSIKNIVFLNLLTFYLQITPSIKISHTGTERMLRNFICTNGLHIYSLIQFFLSKKQLRKEAYTFHNFDLPYTCCCHVIICTILCIFLI